MRRFMHLLMAIGLLLGTISMDVAADAQAEAALDLADIPLTVQELPEDAYQVMSGAYLPESEMVGFIAGPRNLAIEAVEARLSNAMPSRAYVLNLALPEDRAWQESPILALHQTTVYLVEEDTAEAFIELLLDHSNIAFLEPMDPVATGATTVQWVGESGEQLRTVVRDGNIVLEIVMLDATGEPSAADHERVVQGTLDRLDRVRSESSIGLSSMALSLADGDANADFFNAPQTGVHDIYRFRDRAVQPALGEIGADQMGFNPSVEAIYYSNNLVTTGTGFASVSVALHEWDNRAAVEGWYESLVNGEPANQMIDPYFTIGANEAWTPQGVLGVYRVTGSHDGQDYSGIVEIRLQDNIVAVVGYRAIGSLLPDASITSGLMDHQLECLEAQIVCPEYPLVIQTSPPQATPVVSSPGMGSDQFGWSLPELDEQWIVDDQFDEPGYDRLGLRNGFSIFVLESVINHHGEPVQCVLDELHLLEEFEEHSVITLWEDADGNTEGGNTKTQAWIVYRVEPLAEERADQEYVIRIDCFTLVPGSANLVVRHIAPVDFWQDEQDKGQFLRDSIQIPEASGAHGKLGLSAHDRRTTMINIHWIDRAA